MKNYQVRERKKIECAKYCSQFLPKEIGDKLVHLLEALPETNTMLHGDFHIKNLVKQNNELILVDMNTISVGHPIFEFGAMYSTYQGFASVDKNNTKEFLGISLEESKRFLELTYKYYFEDKNQEYIDDVLEKAKIISYLQILWIKSNFMEKDNEIHKKDIEFAKNYLIEHVNKIDTLEF